MPSKVLRMCQKHNAGPHVGSQKAPWALQGEEESAGNKEGRVCPAGEQPVRSGLGAPAPGRGRGRHSWGSCRQREAGEAALTLARLAEPEGSSDSPHSADGQVSTRAVTAQTCGFFLVFWLQYGHQRGQGGRGQPAITEPQREGERAWALRPTSFGAKFRGPNSMTCLGSRGEAIGGGRRG